MRTLIDSPLSSAWLESRLGSGWLEHRLKIGSAQLGTALFETRISSSWLSSGPCSEQHTHMANLLRVKRLFLIWSQWEPIFFTRFYQSRLNCFYQSLARVSAWLGLEPGSVPLRFVVWLDEELVSRLETGESTRFGLWLGLVCSRPGSAQDSAHHSSALLGLLFGTRLISALGSGSAWGSARDSGISLMFVSAQLGSPARLEARGSAQGSEALRTRILICARLRSSRFSK